MLWEFSSLPKIFPVCLQPGCLFFTPPPSNSFPPQTAFHFGGPSDPLSRVGSFQGTLMDANGGLFQIILQGRALICRLACSPHAGYPENMQIPPPPLDTHTKTPVKKLQEHEGRKEEPRRIQTRKKRMRMRLIKDKGKSRGRVCQKGRD